MEKERKKEREHGSLVFTFISKITRKVIEHARKKAFRAIKQKSSIGA